MARLQRLIIITVVLFAFVAATDAPDPPPLLSVSMPAFLPPVYQEGEELTYEVSWTVFKIGTIRIRSLGNFRAQAWIDSYEDLPFVDLHSVYYATMDSTLFSRGSWSVEKNGELWDGLSYLCDTAGTRLFVDRISVRDLTQAPVRTERVDTLTLGARSFVDGLAIGFFPRLLIHTLQQADIPTVLNGRLGTTTFFYTGERTAEEIEAVDRPVKVVEVHGNTNVVGVFGMSGEFTGWFSDDTAAVPIKGQLKVLLGSVTVELLQWKRRGWSPPT